jgi:hypothetical protein
MLIWAVRLHYHKHEMDWKALTPKTVIYLAATWLSMSLLGYGIAIKKYAATHPNPVMMASSGGDFVIAGLLLLPAVLLIHVGLRRLRPSPESP